MVLTSKRLILYFNPRSHERSDCYSNISLTFSSYFNPRSHERSDATTLRQGIYRLNFNPRSHERSDLCNISLVYIVEYFNPRSHERSDAHSQRVSVTRSKFQSTLPREERRTDKGPWLCVTEFQSTLPREERLITRLHTAQDAYFNPRSHERSDNSFHYFLTPFNISIHAPTRGATSTASARLLLSTYFNPRSHERSDLSGSVQLKTDFKFQSTLPREERP